MKKVLGLLAILCVSPAHAIQVNTAAAVIADSANTDETAVYRDTNGSFEAGPVGLNANGSTDILQLKVDGSTVARIGPNGHIAPPVYTKAQISTLVPDFVGATITCSDCNFAYNDCKSSGTAVSQWFALKTSTGGILGSGTKQNGCGVGQ